MERLVDIFIWAALLQGLFLGWLYIFSSKHKSLANKLLGLFILAFVLEALTFIPLGSIWGYSTDRYFTLPEVKMLLPIFFLHYVLEKLGRVRHYFGLLKTHYSFALSFLLVTLFNVCIYVLKGQTIYELFDFGMIESLFMIMQYYAFFFTIAAIIISIWEILKYSNLVKNTYSDLELLQIRWLWQFVLAIIPIVLVWGMELIWILLGGRGESIYTTLIWFLVIIFIYFLSYKAYQQKNLLDKLPDSARGEKKEQLAPENSNPEDYEELGIQLQEFMRLSKIYTRHDLTLYDLSREVDVSPRLISACINRKFRNNFAEWVNSFRVKEALDNLNDPAYSHLSVEGIGSDSGFKSRSAMYAAFKKQTGHSPGHFRQV
ncbi:helix-turn-helix domain-containing protein [Lentiprolixibacter aurantiacus]|uniref:Helix-turn-helix domain-containing protein n=1 Tax=Lentiprolixibacter aurantiacus TaxID=2993939 RepID=A0AAE3MLQ7_9FLAO|nr:helix-turn-helix domain-containing protein [Lentiprolixibacter aurantiacus]MCX2720095.1 helix-turn-helix domain-containing protein [Lentiprolixibacter aurantiacus]